MVTPRPQTGKHLTAFTIQGLKVAPDGTLTTDGAAVNIKARRRGLRQTKAVERKEINGASSKRHNEVVLATGQSASLEVFLINDTTDPNPLETLWDGLDANGNEFEYFQLAWTAGTATGSIEAKTFVGVKGDLNINYDGRDEHICTLDLGPCDIGTSQTTRVLS